MAGQLNVEVVSVAERIWSGTAQMLVARTTEGELGVLPGHEPLLGQLAHGSQVRVKRDGLDELCYDVSGGFLSVSADGVTVLADSAKPGVAHPMH